MEDEPFKRRSASFGSSLTYRPPTPRRNRNGQESNLRRTEHIHLVESDSDTPTQNIMCMGESLSSSDSNERHPALIFPLRIRELPSVPAPAYVCCKGVQVDDEVFLDSNAYYQRPVIDPMNRPLRRDHASGCNHNATSLPSSSADGAETSDASLSMPFSSPSSSDYHHSEFRNLEDDCLIWRRSSPYGDHRQHKRSHQNRRQTVTQSLVLVEDPRRQRMFIADGHSPLPSDCSCGSRVKSDSNISRIKRKIRNGYNYNEVSTGHRSDTSTSSGNTVGSPRRRSKSGRNVSNSRSRTLVADYADARYYNHERRFPTYSMPPVHSEDINGLHKIQQLESDKQNLLLQVSVLNEQVDAQKEKIKELEEMIDEKTHQIRELKQSLHEERMGKSAAENTRLELMTEISSLRQKLTIAERERRDSEEKCRRIEADMDLLSDRVGSTDAEHTSFRRLTGNTSIISNEKGSEVDKLRRTLETVIASNEEKDHKIEGLRAALAKYKKLQEYVLLGQHRKGSDVLKELPSPDAEYSRDLKSPPSPGIETLRQCHSLGKYTSKNLSGCRLPCQSSSLHECEAACPTGKEDSASVCSSSNLDSSSHSVTINKSNSLENVRPSSPKVTLSKTAYGTIPRQNGPQALQHLQEQLQTFECRSTATNTDIVDGYLQSNRKSCEEPNRGSRNKSSGVSFGKGFFKLRSGKRSSSAPELAPSESITIPTIEREYSSASPTPQPTMQPFIKPERSKGFRKFFTKWRQRSGSQNLEKIEGDFRRGGTRATAGPRLGWSRDISTDPNIPFPRWTTDFVIEWLHKIGLSMYISECKRWRCNGEQLLNARPQEIEKQLSIKNPMHKKKLLLSLQAMKSDSLPVSINSMDYFWVVRWLDDVGLPQYKDAFSDARIDGRILHYLTIDDLLTLKVTNQLHHTSIKRGIQLLRERNFDPHCLVRRSMPDEDKAYTPEMVALWTNHRVMEWLRTVDLSEYAPNLRGSGVHGALIVYEPKFNTDLFATLLNIPPTKTLLRRHLATHFKTIVGADIAQVKRDLETDQLYTPLTPNIKIKGIRKPQFQLKKKKGKVDGEGEEFVCPMDIPVGAESVKPDGDKLVVRRNSDPVPQEKSLNVEDEKAVEEIGAVSKEITSLTNLLQEEKLLKNAPTTNV